MNKKSQSGFAILELVVVIVLLAAVVEVGYYVWHSHKITNSTTSHTATNLANNASASYQSPTTTVSAAPQVNTASDLNTAMQALNQTNVIASNTDSSQLNSQVSNF